MELNQIVNAKWEDGMPMVPFTDRLNTYFARSEAQKILIELEKRIGDSKYRQEEILADIELLKNVI